MSVKLSPIGNDAPFVDASGNPLNLGELYTYIAGSATPENTYTTSAGNVANANPIVLNSNGYPASGGNVVSIWLTEGVSYKFVLQNAAGTIIWTRDNIEGVNDTSSAQDQWVSGPAPTFVSTTSFTLVGDQTGTFQVNRRVKTTNSGGTIYSTITASTFGAVTTVTVVNDSGVLDSGLSAVSYSLLSATNNALPLQIFPTMAQAAKVISGLTYSNNGADATNDLDFATGAAIDSTGAYAMRLTAALTKQSDVVWAVGTNAGMLDTGVVGNSDYYLHLIARPDTGVVDVLASLSATSPTMPANYTYRRLFGWFRRVGGTIVAFDTYETEGGGLELQWKASRLDVDSTSLTTSRLASALVSTPQNFSTVANIRVVLTDAGGGLVVIQCPDETDAAPSATASPGYTFNTVAGVGIAADIQIRTSATGTIAARASAAIDNYRVFTVGFRWARRN